MIMTAEALPKEVIALEEHIAKDHLQDVAHTMTTPTREGLHHQAEEVDLMTTPHHLHVAMTMPMAILVDLHLPGHMEIPTQTAGTTLLLGATEIIHLHLHVLDPLADHVADMVMADTVVVMIAVSTKSVTKIAPPEDVYEDRTYSGYEYVIFLLLDLDYVPRMIVRHLNLASCLDLFSWLEGKDSYYYFSSWS